MIDLGTWAGEGYGVEGGKIDDREHPQDRTRGRGPLNGARKDSDEQR
jgi:hypothetical protein